MRPLDHAGGRTFAELTETERDDAIDRWHTDSACTLPLHEYLGMDREEYRVWLEEGWGATGRARTRNGKRQIELVRK